MSHPHQNHLIAALPGAEWSRWEPSLELVELKLGQVLIDSGCTSPYVYFPTTGIVSLLYMTQEGATSEVAVVGNDGVVGISLFMGGNTTPSLAVVQHAGLAYRLRAQLVKEEVERSGAVLQMLLQYTQSMIAQVTKTAVCNRFHSVDQLLCRRILLSLDRLPSDVLLMTQELMASLLGVRRQGVTTAALRLKKAGIIRYNRGQIVVLDRSRLELGMR